MAVRGCSHSNSTDANLHHDSSFSTLKTRRHSFIRRRPKASQSVSQRWVHTAPCRGYSLWRSTRGNDGLLSRSNVSASARGVLAGTYFGVDGRQPADNLNPNTQHPAMAGLRLTEIPLDLEPVSFRLAVDELERLYEIPLIAPRVFRKVAHQRALAAAGGRYASAPAVAGAVSEETAAVRVAAAAAALPSIPPVQQSGASYTATGDVTCKAADVGVVGVSSPRASDLSAAESRTAYAPMLHTVTAATGAFSGFLVSELLRSRRAVMGIPSLGSTGVDEAVVLGVLEPPPSPPSPSPPSRPPLPPPPQQPIQDVEVEAEVAESGQTVDRQLNTDPRDFPMLPPHRLATLLLDCAARKVPLRISVLQAYVKQVSYMASELTAEELVSALEGLSKYNFQSSQPLMVSRTAGRRVSGGASNTGSRIGGIGQSGGRSGHSSRWADVILKSLLDPLVSERTTPSPAAGQADSAPAGGNRSSVRGSSNSSSSSGSGSGRTRGSSGSSSSNKWLDRFGKTSIEGPQSELPKVASLEPLRFVQLTQILVQLGISPPPDWMDGFLYGSSHVVPRMSGSEVIELLALLAALSAAPAAAWWNVVLDSWAPTKPLPLPPPPPPPPPAGGSGGECSSAEVAVTSSGGESAGSGSRSVAAVTLSDAMAFGSGGGGPLKTNHRVGATVRTTGNGSGDEAACHGRETCRLSDLDVRSAILYGISRLGPPHGTGVPALAARLPGWARATLYDIARAVLLSGHLAWGTPKGPYGSRAGWSSSPPPSGRGTAAAAPIAVHSVRKTGYFAIGAAEAGAPLRDGAATSSHSQIYVPLARAAPEPHAIAQVLAALPAVLPNASGWASEPSWHGSGVLAVLLAALEPQLHELPPGLMVDLLRGLAASRLHPGPRFLTLHAMILKRCLAELTPRELLLAAKCYSKLGLSLKGGLRVAVLKARKALRSVQGKGERQAGGDHLASAVR
ncbi:hypothetical protein VaNZ11_015608 [Volvox africanus]|uniref:Uncharacterized protein n=1 Tax=Volvox africanus TaxID=51714 RepID=A0ABQ5SMP3_9CHLO|nr:hypothetical protein VaNZ11_015608 [Volvox africanus]